MTALSIVIPAKNEALNLPGLLEEIAAACAGVEHEVIIVDDGSDDDTPALLARLMAERANLRLLRHDRSGGQSAAVHSGVRVARGGIICTLDADGQNPPENLPALFAPLMAPGSDRVGIVAGQRVGRRDTLSKRWASRAANAIRQSLLRDGTRDTGCGLKLFRRDAFLALPYFDHMHRYLPALFARDGWQVTHVDVAHAERHAGRSNYANLGRALVGIYDLIGVAWLIRRRKKARGTEVLEEVS